MAGVRHIASDPTAPSPPPHLPLGPRPLADCKFVLTPCGWFVLSARPADSGQRTGHGYAVPGAQAETKANLSPLASGCSLTSSPGCKVKKKVLETHLIFLIFLD